jgi:drug/metabolite transporter (DMT)-like permease
MNVKKSYPKYIASLLLFGSNGIVASHIQLTSYYIVLLRTLIGSLLLLVLFLSARRRFTFLDNKRDLIYIGISGIAMGASWMFLYEAYAQIGVGVSSLLYYTGPVIVMVLSPILFKEKLTPIKLVGFSAVVIGVILVNGLSGEALNPVGVVCGLMSAAMYSVMVMANKKSEKITGMENSLVQLIVSFLTVAAFVGIKNGGYSVQITAGAWLWIAILGIVNTGIGCYFYFSSIGDLPVQTVAVCGYIEPLSAVLFSVLLLGETMLPLQIIGAILIIGGAVFGECVKNKR